MASFNLFNFLGLFCWFSAFKAAHCELTEGNFIGRKQFMQFDFLSHCHWFPVITKNADTDSSERISEGNQSRK
jgi:hypothetical protein